MSRTDECPPRALLGALLAGELPDPEATGLWEHLQTCPACEEASAALEAELDTHEQAYRRAARSRPPTEGDLPQRIGEYEILDEIGRGGMGVVYRACHLPLRRTVALKLLRAAAFANPEERRRFRAEAVAVAKLQHPNVVQVFDVGEWRPADGVPIPYVVFELVEGGSLAARVAGQPQDFRQTAAWVSTVARAAHHAHEAGIVHRDLKPANVLLRKDGTPKLCDFGIAKDLDVTTHSESGAILGTAGYLAPEQIDRKLAAIGPATDVYALGVVLYELLTGRLPFAGSELLTVLAAIRTEEPARPRVHRADVPADLEAVCLGCLEKNPARRYGSAADVADDLDRFLRGEPVRARLPGPVRRATRWARRHARTIGAALLMTAVVAGMAVWAATRPSPLEPIPAPRPLQSFPEYLALLAQADKAWRLREPHERVQGLLDECAPEQRHWEWYHLRQKFKPADHVFDAHAGDVRAVCYSPEGDRLASGGEDGVIWMLEPATGRPLRSLKARTPVRCLAFLPTGKALAAGGEDGSVTVWDLEAGTTWRLGKHAGPVSALAVIHDGKRLASAAPGDPVKGWDLATGEVVFSVPTAGKQEPLSIAAHPATDRLAVAVGEQLTLWETEQQRSVASHSHRDGVAALTYTPDGARLAVATGIGSVWVYDGATGAEQGKGAVTRWQEELARQIAFGPDGQVLAGISENGAARLWSLEAVLGGGNSHVLTLRGGAAGAPGAALAYHPRGTQLAVGIGRDVQLWEIGPGRRDVAYLSTGARLPVQGVGLGPEGRLLAAPVGDNAVGLWDIEAGGPPTLFDEPLRRARDVVWSPDGRWLAAAAHGKGPARVWDAGTRKVAWSFPAGGARNLMFDPSGKLIASLEGESQVVVRDVRTGESVLTVGPPSPGRRALAFAPDGRRLAVARKEGVTVVDIPSGREAYSVPAASDSDWALAFSPDGQLLATLADHRNILLCDGRTGQAVRTLLMEGRDAVALGFSPDGRRLASGTQDGLIRLWEPTSGTVVLDLEGYGAASPVIWGPGGRRLAAGNLAPGGVMIWDAPGFDTAREDKTRRQGVQETR